MNKFTEVTIGLSLSVAIVIGLATVLKRFEQGRDPVQVTEQAAQNDERPKPATFTDCPMAVIDGVSVALGQECMYVAGELVGVRIKAGGGWVMAQ